MNIVTVSLEVLPVFRSILYVKGDAVYDTEYEVSFHIDVVTAIAMSFRVSMI